jgi:hypothetical protein
VLQLLLLVMPFALAGAVSPVMAAEQTVLLAGPGGRRAAGFFAAGAAATLLISGAVFMLLGRAIAVPDRPGLVAAADIAIGLALVAFAVALRRRRPAPPAERAPRRGPGARGAFGFGVFSMATNFSTLAFMVPAARVIAASEVPSYGHVLVLCAVVGVASAPAWLPPVLTALAPGPASRGLNAFAALLDRRGHGIAVIVTAVVGAVLLAHGLWALAGR